MGRGLGGGRGSREERSRALQHMATTQKSEEERGERRGQSCEVRKAQQRGREARRKEEGTLARGVKPYSEAERRDGEEESSI